MDALKDIPTVEAPLLTQQGSAHLQKTDIFRKIMWFGYDSESNWTPLNIERVNHIIELNKAGKKPVNLLDDNEEEKKEEKGINNDLKRMDEKYAQKAKKKKKKKNNKKKVNNPNKANTPAS